jgi:DNA polymerase alpha subunit B
MDLDLPSSSTPSSDQAAAAAAGAQAEATAVPELSMVVATGPFTLTDDCSYEPLGDLLKGLQRSPPQVLLLVGPFVDEEHPAVAGGLLNLTYQQLFQQQVRMQIRVEGVLQHFGATQSCPLVFCQPERCRQ